MNPSEFGPDSYYRLEQYADGTLYEHFKGAGLPDIVIQILPKRVERALKQAVKKKIEVRQMGDENPYGNV